MATLSGIITPSNILTASNTQTLTNKTIAFGSNTLTGVQPTLVSGTSIKTVNSTSLLGSGDIAISAGFTLGTPVATTSGTSIDITGIPAGVKQIVVSFKGVSTSGTSKKTIRMGDSGGIETTGYDSSGASMTSGAQDVNVSTDGFIVHSELAAHVLVGSATLTLENSSTNTWALTGNFSDSATGRVFASSGIKSLSDVCDRIRLTTNNGTDTFDAGEINIAFI